MSERRPERRWYQFSLASLFVLTTLVALWLGVGPRVQTYWLVQRISNDDVHVDGNFIGLDVGIDSDAASQILRLGKVANPSLQAALCDPKRFAAAHVLLTTINEKGELPSASHWDHLQIDLHADGRVDFHPEQISKIQKLWSDRLSGNKESGDYAEPQRDWEIADSPL